jgi:hypothetical protein
VRSTTFLFTTLCTSIQIFGEIRFQTGLSGLETTLRRDVAPGAPVRALQHGARHPQRPGARFLEAARAPRRIEVRPCHVSRPNSPSAWHAVVQRFVRRDPSSCHGREGWGLGPCSRLSSRGRAKGGRHAYKRAGVPCPRRNFTTAVRHGCRHHRASTSECLHRLTTTRHFP